MDSNAPREMDDKQAAEVMKITGLTDDHLHVLLDQQRGAGNLDAPWLGYDSDPTDLKTTEEGWLRLADEARSILTDLLSKA